MKNWILLTYIIIAAALTGCGKEERNLGAAVPGPTSPIPCVGSGCQLPQPPPGVPGPTPGPGATATPPVDPTAPPPEPVALTTGATGVLVPATTSVFQTYTGVPLNNTGPIQINVNLSPNGSSPKVYLGAIRIRYYDKQPYGRLILHDGYFNTGSSTGKGNDKNIFLTDKYTATQGYRIFGEDTAGAIIIVMKAKSGGDANNPELEGKAYFKNFNSNAPNPLYSGYFDGYYWWPANPNAFCWTGQIKTGPYDCRNDSIDPTTNGSTKFTYLGKFELKERVKALGE